MELLEIKSTHDLTALSPERRRPGSHSYLVSCRQFMSVLGSSRKQARREPVKQDGRPLCFMTLSADQIWVTDAEVNKIVAAIEEAHSPVSLT